MNRDSIQQMLNDAPKVLYKYRRWDKLVNNDDFHRNILIKKELYYSSPDELNDPFDLNIKQNFSALPINKRVDFYFNILKKNNPFPSESQLYEDIWRYKANLTDDFMNNLADIQIEMIRDATKIFCLSESEKISHMWSMYSNNHTGYCIGFKTANLVSRKCGMIPKVFYYDTNPNIVPISNFNNNDEMLIQMTYKHIEWQHEKEYRFLLLDKDERIINYFAEDVAEIILGSKIQTEQKEEIMALCGKEFHDVPIYQMELHSRDYALNKIRIK